MHLPAASFGTDTFAALSILSTDVPLSTLNSPLSDHNERFKMGVPSTGATIGTHQASVQLTNNAGSSGPYLITIEIIDTSPVLKNTDSNTLLATL